MGIEYKDDRLLRDLAIEGSKLGSVELAKEIASGIESIELMTESMASIALQEALIGDVFNCKKTFFDAKKRVLDEKDGFLQDLCYRNICYKEAEAGLFADAKDTVKRIRYDENKNWSFSYISYAQSKVKKYEDAKETSGKINNDTILCPLLCDIAEQELGDGFFADAETTLGNARKSANRIENKIVKKISIETIDELVDMLKKRYY